MSANQGACANNEYDDGWAFKFEVPKEDLALFGVTIEDERPKLLFDVSKKVPTITEEELATCIGLSLSHQRPEFFYCRFLPGHPLEGTGRHYKSYEPASLRRTTLGENLAKIDWLMKCLMVGVRSDENREHFWSWSDSSKVDGLASYEDFHVDLIESSVLMKCKPVSAYQDESQLLFNGEPQIYIDYESSPSYSKYISEIYDSIAYYDEPLFLKMREYVKLIIISEWLRDQGVRFSNKWLQEHAGKTADPDKPIQFQLSPEDTKSLENLMKQEAKAALSRPELRPALSDDNKLTPKLSVAEPTFEVRREGCFEVKKELTITHPTLDLSYIQRATIRVTTTNDFDFLYEGIDPNWPVTIDGKMQLVQPDVKSWSELMLETELFPCKWLQNPDDVMCRTPALTGGISTSSIKVEKTARTAPCPKNTFSINGTKSRRTQRVPSRNIPSQSVFNAPSSSAHVETQASQINATIRASGQEMYGAEDWCSSTGMTHNGAKRINQPPLHATRKITQLINGKEVSPSIRESMYLRLPPKEDETSKDSAISSPASTPSVSSYGSQAYDASSITSDSGVSTATLCSSGSDTTLADDM